jgi:hypothetical protein
MLSPPERYGKDTLRRGSDGEVPPVTARPRWSTSKEAVFVRTAILRLRRRLQAALDIERDAGVGGAGARIEVSSIA